MSGEWGGVIHRDGRHGVHEGRVRTFVVMRFACHSMRIKIDNLTDVYEKSPENKELMHFLKCVSTYFKFGSGGRVKKWRVVQAESQLKVEMPPVLTAHSWDILYRRCLYWVPRLDCFKTIICPTAPTNIPQKVPMPQPLQGKAKEPQQSFL
jgi:hypothetical protein